MSARYLVYCSLRRTAHCQIWFPPAVASPLTQRIRDENGSIIRPHGNQLPHIADRTGVPHDHETCNRCPCLWCSAVRPSAYRLTFGRDGAGRLGCLVSHMDVNGFRDTTGLNDHGSTLTCAVSIVLPEAMSIQSSVPLGLVPGADLLKVDPSCQVSATPLRVVTRNSCSLGFPASEIQSTTQLPSTWLEHWRRRLNSGGCARRDGPYGFQ